MRWVNLVVFVYVPLVLFLAHDVDDARQQAQQETEAGHEQDDLSRKVDARYDLQAACDGVAEGWEETDDDAQDQADERAEDCPQ